MAFLTTSCLYLRLICNCNSSAAPRPLWPDVALPTTSHLSPSPTLTGTLTSVLTEWYNSSTPTQSPTWFLESHVGSSSSGNNCHAVHRSLSSGASVYECTMGIFFTSSHFISQFPPMRFPLITATRMCHFLPVHHLEWHFWPGRRSKYNKWSLFVWSFFVGLVIIWPWLFDDQRTPS